MILAKIFHHFPSNPWIFAAGVGSRCLVFGALRTDSDALPTGCGRADGHGDPSDGRNGSDGHLAKPGHGDDVEILMIYYSYIIHIINKMDMRSLYHAMDTYTYIIYAYIMDLMDI